MPWIGPRAAETIRRDFYQTITFSFVQNLGFPKREAHCDVMAHLDQPANLIGDIDLEFLNTFVLALGNGVSKARLKTK